MNTSMYQLDRQTADLYNDFHSHFFEQLSKKFSIQKQLELITISKI